MNDFNRLKNQSEQLHRELYSALDAFKHRIDYLEHDQRRLTERMNTYERFVEFAEQQHPGITALHRVTEQAKERLLPKGDVSALAANPTLTPGGGGY